MGLFFAFVSVCVSAYLCAAGSAPASVFVCVSVRSCVHACVCVCGGGAAPEELCAVLLPLATCWSPRQAAYCSGVAAGHGIVFNVMNGQHWVLLTGTLAVFVLAVMLWLSCRERLCG